MVQNRFIYPVAVNVGVYGLFQNRFILQLLQQKQCCKVFSEFRISYLCMEDVCLVIVTVIVTYCCNNLTQAIVPMFKQTTVNYWHKW